jgi:hypothetical protein
MTEEPAVYRPFAVLAFTATLVAGTPLGLAMLVWFYILAGRARGGTTPTGPRVAE